MTGQPTDPRTDEIERLRAELALRTEQRDKCGELASEFLIKRMHEGERADRAEAALTRVNALIDLRGSLHTVSKDALRAALSVPSVREHQNDKAHRMSDADLRPKMKQPEGYVREPSPVTDRWAYEAHPNVEGFHVAIVDELARKNSYLRWELDPWHRPCRWTIDSQHHTCKRPSVVRLNRGLRGRSLWYSYCADHTYGRVWDGERLLTTVLVSDAS